MSFKATFKVGGEEYNVLGCNYALKQETDATGRPSSVTRGGMVTVTVESTDSTALYEWQCSSFDHKDASLTFFKRDTDAKLKQVDFKTAYMVNFKEEFNFEGATPLRITFTLSAEEMTSGSGVFTNQWAM